MGQNLDRWRSYTKDLVSPDAFIDWGFYAMIGASLRRKVWQGDFNFKPLFPNLYVILTANPGVGKSLVLDVIYDMLTYHKRKSIASNGEVKDANGIDVESANQFMLDRNRKKGTNSIPPIIRVAADTTTFEALIQDFVKAYDLVKYEIHNAELNKMVPAYYLHNSLAFCLSELSSLFQEKSQTKTIINFLLTTYDCKRLYEYKTKTQGEDTITNCCLNFLGGTTPGFLQRVFSSDLITEGFASRAHFIYEYANRHERMQPPESNLTQSKERQDILDHILKLTSLYGRVSPTKDASAFIDDWWVKVKTGIIPRPNPSPKLEHYYGRKNIHVQKLAMILHFSDNLGMEVGIEHYQEAIKVLDKAEKKMHLALNFETKNSQAAVAQGIEDYLAKVEYADSRELLRDFFAMCGPSGAEDIRAALRFLREIGKVGVKDSDKFYLIRKS